MGRFFLLIAFAAGCTAAAAGSDGDVDGDLIADVHEGSADGVDTDGDSIPDYRDSDSDNDALLDLLEAGDSSLSTPPIDSDSDGVPDFRDSDSDGNGRLDRLEGESDFDGDGILDFADLDDDDDLIPDVDEIGAVPDFPRDSDGDGVPDIRDVDADGDGIFDSFEGLGDPDEDGIPNFVDLDSDGDGYGDAFEAGDDDPRTPPEDTDLDGVPDFLDADSDSDGVPDAVERREGLDPRRDDSDGDGAFDLVEVTFGSDGADPADNPRERGQLVFYMPFGEPPIPRLDSVRFRTTIQLADAYFLFDRTCSMDNELDAAGQDVQRVIENLTCATHSTCGGDLTCPSDQVCFEGTCIDDPERRGCIPSLWTGTGYFDGRPEAGNSSYRNVVSVNRDPDQTRRGIPTDTGSGSEEELFLAVACVADPSIPECATAGCARRGVGCPGFRRDAVRMLILITDEDNECTSTHCPNVNSALGAASRLERQNIFFVGVNTGNLGALDEQMEEIAVESDSLDIDGRSILLQGTGASVVSAMSEGIQRVAAGVPLFVVAELRDDEGDGFDATTFVSRLEINQTGGSCSVVRSTADLDGDGFDDTFTRLRPGTSVCWNVVARRNTAVRPREEAQVFTATIDVLGDDALLDSRRVFFFVPPRVDAGPID